MATATTYTINFLGANTKKTYTVSAYTADTAGAINTFNRSGAAAATSSNYIKFDEPVILTDFSMPTGGTQTSGYMTENGAVKDSAIIDYVTHVSTNAQRPKLAVPYKAGAMIGHTTI